MRWIILFVIVASFKLVIAQEKPPVLLEEVIVLDGRLFDKEASGAKKTHLDSLVLAENLNHTLSELLSENTSVFIKSYGRGSMATASFRGTAPSHTQVLWNGMSINSPMLGMVDFSLLPVYFIDDLTLKHGGASEEDIGGALGGSISITNKPSWTNKLSSRAVQGIGSFNTLEEFVQVNIGNEKFQSKTRLYYTYSKNDFPFVNDAVIDHPRVRNAHAAYTMYSGMQEFYFRPDTHNTLSLNAWLHSSDRSIPRLNSYEGSDSANINKQYDKSLRVHSSWEHFYKRGKITTSAGVNVQDLDYNLLNLVSGMGYQSGIYSTSNAKSWISKVQLVHDLSKKHGLQFSVNANHHSVSTLDSVKKTGYEKQRDEVLLFGSYYRNFFDRLNVKASLRQDNIDGKFIPLIPYLGIDYKLIHDQPIYLKANITRNYHVPTLNDLYWQPGGNPSLKPEQGVTKEATIAWQKDFNKLQIESQLNGFYSNITDWILWVPNFKGYWEPHNVRRVVSKGIEFTFKGKYRIGQVQLMFNGNYAMTKSLNYGDKKTWGDDSYGKQLVYIPVHSGNAFVSLRYKTYTLTYQHNSYSRRFTTSSNDLTTRDNLPSYFMNQVYAGKEFKAKRVTFEAQLKVYNLFDEYYRSVLGRRMPGRNYMLLLMVRF